MLPFRPAQFSEAKLIERFLDGTLKPGDLLPAERLLAPELGVTRPTLRETLKKLHRDGWIEIRHGKPTRIRDFWRDGGLNVLNGLSFAPESTMDPVIDHLLQVRAVIAPAYTHLAVQNHAMDLHMWLEKAPKVSEDPTTFCRYDWDLHHQLALWSKNPIYPLILNGFKKLYAQVAEIYFSRTENRSASIAFYDALKDSALGGDSTKAKAITEHAMLLSHQRWLDRGRT